MSRWLAYFFWGGGDWNTQSIYGWYMDGYASANGRPLMNDDWRVYIKSHNQMKSVDIWTAVQFTDGLFIGSIDLHYKRSVITGREIGYKYEHLLGF